MPDIESDYILPRKAGLTEATALRDQARQSDLKSGFIVDASQVEVLRAPVVVVLIAIDDALRDSGAKLAVRDPAGPFISAFSNLGLYARLMSMDFVS
ncbi:hypothetical protein [Pontivivens insulae]|uniref:STAS domain-containing protein n=1 Tax=Pontivivens insulae TaxID=1639689 RepID=A0A2R8A6R8_9RHOB|nr:hypothetical protein [Pontivivens insulae]RED17973.1 hypothetical protein DFR53_0161 [Pontivivens insulae]SPF27862.1 hypothetical protein POI8812_00157 [Pontivivens insulae]